MSRSTQGVTLINLGEGEKLAGLERVVERDDEEDDVRRDSPARCSRHDGDDRQARTATRASLPAPSRRDRRARPRDPRAHSTQRAAHAQAIGALKGGGAAYRPEREAQVLRAMQAEQSRPAAGRSGHRRYFAQVMSACLALEQPLRIAYLGPAGTFQPRGGRASISAQSVDAEPCATIDEVFRAAESGQTDYAVVPVENSTEGAVGRTLDLMCQTPLVDLRRDQAPRPAEPAVERGGARPR